MKNTLNLNSFIQRFKSSSVKSQPANSICSVGSRKALLTLLAFAFILVGGWTRLAAQADVVPGGYVKIQPNAVTLNQGAVFQLRAAVMNPVGFELPNRKVTWSSSNPAIASVNSSEPPNRSANCS